VAGKPAVHPLATAAVVLAAMPMVTILPLPTARGGAGHPGASAL
jgi:hypothetical protein